MQALRPSSVLALIVGLSCLAGHGLADSGAGGGKCESLKEGIESLPTDGGFASNRTYSVFPAILDELGFDAKRIDDLKLNTALVPNDRAWEEFFLEIGGTDANPISLIKRNPDVFKQIVLHHFANTLDRASGSSATGLSKVIELDREGFLNSRAICGMNDSRFITLELEYSRATEKYTFKDQYSKHFEGKSTSTPCKGRVIIHTVDTVLYPCPIPHMFQPEAQFGCASLAGVLPSFGNLAYRESNLTGSIFDSLKHPNFPATRSPAGLTFFMPTPDALGVAGLSDNMFLRLSDVIDHIISAHVIQGQVCLGGGGDVSSTFGAGEGGRWDEASGDRPAERKGEAKTAKVAPGLTLGSNTNAEPATPQPQPESGDGAANLVSPQAKDDAPPADMPTEPEEQDEDEDEEEDYTSDAVYYTYGEGPKGGDEDPGESSVRRKLASDMSVASRRLLKSREVLHRFSQRVSERAQARQILREIPPVATDTTSIPTSGAVAEESDPIFGMSNQAESAPVTAITLVTSDFCGPSASIEIVEGTGQYPASASIISPNGWSASTTSRVNLRVCGGYAHEIDTVLMPCPAEQYRSSAGDRLAQVEPGSSSAPVVAVGKGCGLVGLLCWAAFCMLM